MKDIKINDIKLKDIKLKDIKMKEIKSHPITACTILALLFLALFFTACAPITNNYNEKSNNHLIKNPAPPEKIKIGISQPFTGPTAFAGEWVKTGIKMAIDDLPIDEKSQFDLVFEDDGCSGKMATDALTRLTATSKVDYIIGPTCNAAIVSTLDMMKQADITQLTTGVVNDKVAAAGEYHFTLQPRVRDLMYPLAEFVFKTGKRKIAIFHLSDEFGVESAKHFSDRFTQLGGNIVETENFAPTDTDFRTQITKLNEKDNQDKFDGIFMMSYGAWLVNQLKQMDEIGLKTQLYGPTPINDPRLVAGAGKLADGIIYAYPTNNPMTPTQLAFEARYAKAYSKEADIYTEIGYDTFTTLWAHIKECSKDNSKDNNNDNNKDETHNNDLTKQCVRQKLALLQNFDGVGGTISLDSDGVGKRTISIKQIVNGTFQIIE